MDPFFEGGCTRVALTSIIELQISKLYSREIGQFCLKHLGQDLKIAYHNSKNFDIDKPEYLDKRRIKPLFY